MDSETVFVMGSLTPKETRKLPSDNLLESSAIRLKSPDVCC